MLIIGTEILVQLQSFLNNFLFEGIFETVIAIIVGFCAVKLSRRIIGSLLGAYWGLILGGILGYIIGRNLVWICCGAIAVAFAFLALCNLIKRGSDFMIAFIFFMSVTYVLIKLLLDVFDIEFYSLFNNYSQDKVEYLTRDIVLGVSLVFGIVGALVAVKL